MNTISSAVLLVFLMPCGAPTQGTGPKAHMSPKEQSQFSAEDLSVKRPVRVPASVIKVMAQDADVQKLLKDEPNHELPQKWLSASEAHLGVPSEQDLVVMGTGLIRGANVTTFWVFGPAEGGYKLLLQAVGHDLIIMGTRSNGYRDIKVLAATAEAVSEILYKHDGKVYEKTGEKAGRIR